MRAPYGLTVKDKVTGLSGKVIEINLIKKIITIQTSYGNFDIDVEDTIPVLTQTITVNTDISSDKELNPCTTAFKFIECLLSSNYDFNDLISKNLAINE